MAKIVPGAVFDPAALSWGPQARATAIKELLEEGDDTKEDEEDPEE